MTLTEAIATPIRHRRSSRHAALLRAPLEDLVAEVVSRLDEQGNDHAEQSAEVVREFGRDAVEDRIRARDFDNLRHVIRHGTREQQLAAADRLEAHVERDEQQEERVLRALLAAFGGHNVDLNALRRLVRDNARAITHGEPVVGINDEPTIPAALLARQKAVRA